MAFLGAAPFFTAWLFLIRYIYTSHYETKLLTLVVVFQNENGDYYFTFGDNNDSSNAVWTISETVTHSYSAPGYYTVRVLTSTIAGNASTEIVVLIESTCIMYKAT